MKLLTKADLRKLESQDPYHPDGPGRELSASEALALVKFFTPDAQWTWFAVSASQDPDTGDVQFFGLVQGLERELGYFWLSELERVRGPLGLPVERDLYWEPVPLADLIN
jgi:hypothetical protein